LIVVVGLDGAYGSDENSNQSDTVSGTAGEGSFRQGSIHTDANSCEMSKVRPTRSVSF